MTINYYAWGDSITNRVGASDDDHSYINLIADNYGWTLTENGSNNAQAKDKAIGSIAFVVETGQIHSYMTGYNDMRFWNTDAQLKQYELSLMAQVAHLAIPDSKKIFANSASVTETGTWVTPSTAIRLRDTARYSNSINATATFNFTGDTLYIWFNKYSNPLGGIENDIQISVDGRPVTYHTPFGSELTDSNTAQDKQTQLIVISKLTNTTHTAEIKQLSSHLSGWDFAYGFDSTIKRSSPMVYVGNIMRTDSTGYSAGSVSLPVVGSDIQVSKYNQIVHRVCSQLAADGLWVAEVNILEGFIPIDDTTDPINGMLETPIAHLHPNDKGHQHIADAYISVIDKGISGVRPTESNNSTSNYSTIKNSIILAEG